MIDNNGTVFMLVRVIPSVLMNKNPVIDGLTIRDKNVLMCNFLSNLSRNAIARQVAGELHSVTWVVSQFFCCMK